MSLPISIQDFPEELLEYIIALCVVASPLPNAVRSPSWHTPRFKARRTAPLLVSRAFNRIGTPLLYHSVLIANPTQAELVLRTLHETPSISPLIRCLVLSAVTIRSAQVLSTCRNLLLLDFTLDGPSQPSALTPGSQGNVKEPDVIEFCNALSASCQLRHLVVRKPSTGVYLTTPRVKSILSCLADVLPAWDNLETANFAFKFADESPSPRSSTGALSVQVGPITRLTRALSTRPRLHTFSAHLPSTWSDAILRVSTNKRLERIVLTDGRMDVCVIPEIAGAVFPAPATEHHQQAGVLGTGLFFMEARKHVRLTELIKAGTYVDPLFASLLLAILIFLRI
ncbi:hypothetical protein AX15_003276 [Amanita polypyramis BW_CC]|nr:hypothetical protein AX15_003276 [Amanita polypyramis BW_CC]